MTTDLKRDIIITNRMCLAKDESLIKDPYQMADAKVLIAGLRKTDLTPFAGIGRGKLTPRADLLSYLLNDWRMLPDEVIGMYVDISTKVICTKLWANLSDHQQGTVGLLKRLLDDNFTNWVDQVEVDKFRGKCDSIEKSPKDYETSIRDVDNLRATLLRASSPNVPIDGIYINNSPIVQRVTEEHGEFRIDEITTPVTHQLKEVDCVISSTLTTGKLLELISQFPDSLSISHIRLKGSDNMVGISLDKFGLVIHD